MATDKPKPDAILAQVPHEEHGVERRAPAPVHLWNPPVTGKLDMRIARDGTWYYEDGPITRQSMAQLFSGILRLDDDGTYYLVTPVERWAIEVEDAPFVAIAVDVKGQGKEQVLSFTTNLDDSVEAGPDNPIRVQIDPETEEPAPYILMRANLEALMHRNVFYELADIAVDEQVCGQSCLGVWSNGVFFPIDGTERPI